MPKVLSRLRGFGADELSRADILTNAYRKRVVHNLVYKHADWSYATSTWGSIYPQTMCVDETAREILVASSDPHVVSVYDFDTGAYKGKCFKLTAGTDTCQAMLVRYISGVRYLYYRTGTNQLSRFNITSVTNRSTLTAQQSWTVNMTSDFDFRNGVWTLGSNKSNFGGTTFANRARFIRRDDSMNPIGTLELPAMQYGGHVGGGVYSASAFPKVQGFCEGPGLFMVGMGGGYHVGTDSPTGLFWLHGLRAFSASGEVILEALYHASELKLALDAAGYTVGDVVECEGIDYAFGKFWTTTAISSSGNAVANTGGIIFMEEFAGTDANIDMTPRSTVFTSPPVETFASRLAIMDDNNDYRNPADFSVMTTVQQVCEMMQSVGMPIFRFYTNTKNLLDTNGVALPAGCLAEILNCNNGSFIVRLHGAHSIELIRFVAGSPWTQTDSDSGWVNVTPSSGFASQTGAEVFQCRRLNGIIYLRGGMLNTGLTTANTSYDVATLPVGFRPPLSTVGGSLGTAAGNQTAIALILTTGVVTIRTGATVGSYYKFDNFSWPVD